ncbi:MAG: bifunctional metallophosphatase/5'-nucleotidase [Erysipelotrichaceae bacterium]
MQKLTILHSNDIHGDFSAKDDNGQKKGGISLLSGCVSEIRKNTENVIYAISGDMFRGSIIDSEYRGLSTIELVNFLSPDVVTLGNHEVDYGIAHLLFLEKCARFPIINSNLYIKSNHQRLFKPYKIINIHGIRVMFIGIITEEVLQQTRNEQLIGSFIDIWQARDEIGVIIDNYKTTKVDLTVLLTHIGLEEDIKLAEILDPKWGVNLIIGGHSHTKMDQPVVVNSIPIVQAYCGTECLGKMDITIADDQSISYQWQCIEINENNCREDSVMAELLQQYQSATDIKYKRVITTFKRELTHPKRNQETELGNLVADLLQCDSSFDVMLYASGSIRKTALGPIVTYQDLKECFPYNDEVVMLQVTGKQFAQMITYMLRDECFEGDHTEFYQLSKGMRVLYDRNTKQLLEFKLNGKDIVDDMMINIGIQSGYHYNGFSEFFNLPIEEVIKNKKPKTVITSINSIFEEMLSNGNNFDSHIENRIEVI